MKVLHSKIIFVTLFFVSGIIVLVLGIWSQYGALASMIGISQQNNITATSQSAINSQSPVVIGDPVIQRDVLNFSSDGESIDADFILYEDFPVSLTGNLQTSNLKIANKPNNVWMKFIDSEELPGSGENNQTILRVAGAVRPGVPNNFNTTIYIVNVQEGEIVGVSSLPLVRNGIINEIAIVSENIPVKFKEVVVQGISQGNILLYSLIYDHTAFNIDSAMNRTEPRNDLEVDIMPIGVVIDGNVSELPEWLEVRTTNLPISLTENIPEYYGIILTTQNAPEGTHEIAFRETINDEVFVETMTVVVSNSAES